MLASVIIDESNWRYINTNIDKIKKKHFPDRNAEDVEIHVKDMLKRTGVYKRVPRAKIYCFLEDIFKFVSDPSTPLNIIGSIIQKERIYPRVDMELWSYTFVFERFNAYLATDDKSSTHSARRHGIVIIDNEKYMMNQRLHNKLSKLLKSGTKYSNMDHIIEEPFFTDSRWRNLSQICDCISYCIRKKYRKHNPDNSFTKNWLEYYSMIEKKFHSKDGRYHRYGLKIFP